MNEIRELDIVRKKDGSPFINEVCVGKVERIAFSKDKYIASISIYNPDFGFHNCGGWDICLLEKL